MGVFEGPAASGRQKAEDELDEELRFHLEMETEANVRRGMGPAEARRQARLALGGIEKVKEECRDERRGRSLELFGREIRWGLRALRRNPGYTLAAVLTLGLGIGATTAIFSLVNGVLLRPLPYRDGGDLVVLNQAAPGAGLDNLGISINEFYDYRDGNHSVDLVEYHSMSFTLLGHGEPEQVATGVVSWNFFDVLGVPIEQGRGFQPDDEHLGAEAVLVLSYPYWQQKFGGDPSVVGTVVEMNDRPHTIVGVLELIPQFPDENDVYMPTSACPFRARSEERRSENRRAFSGLTVFGRLRPGVSLAAARGDLAAVAGRFAAERPDVYRPEYALAVTATPLTEVLTRGARPMLLMLLAATALVLLIACTNVANLAMARAMRRQRELAVRASLGAGRLGLVRQFLVESALVGLAGGVFGLAIAYAGLDVLVRFTARFTPRAVDVSVDGWVLVFAALVSLATGLLFGSFPALTQRPDLAQALHEGHRATAGRGHLRLRSLLIGVQVAFAMMLLAGAGLMLRSLHELSLVRPGFNAERVLVARVPLNWSKYVSSEDRVGFFQSLEARLAVQPGVEGVAVGNVAPLRNDFRFTRNFEVEGQPLEEGQLGPQLDFRSVSPGYFDTLEIRLVEGRGFTAGDDAGAAQVGIVNRSLARRTWGERSALGRRVTLDGGETWITVVGVVDDVRMISLATEAADELYMPLPQVGFAQSVLLRTHSDPLAMATRLKETVWSIDPGQPVEDIETLEEARDESMATSRVTSMLLVLFAAAALLITATGLGSVVAFSVGQRTVEIGLRMALGARVFDVLAMVLRQSLTVVAVGLAAGVLAALYLGRVALADYLFQTGPRDPASLAGAAVVLLLAAGVACYLPALRAARIEPTVALRAD